MVKLKTTLLGVVSKVKKIAIYLPMLGVLLAPVGVVMVIVWPEWEVLAFWLIMVGLGSLVIGWICTIRETRRRREEADREADREEQRRCAEAKRRRIERCAFLLVLSEIAKKQGMSMDGVDRILERWVGKEK